MFLIYANIELCMQIENNKMNQDYKSIQKNFLYYILRHLIIIAINKGGP